MVQAISKIWLWRSFGHMTYMGGRGVFKIASKGRLSQINSELYLYGDIFSYQSLEDGKGVGL